MPEHWFPPYKNDNKACLLKWSWASVYLWPNESSTCHRNKNVTIPDNYDFNNHSFLIQQREKMKNGEWPSDGKGCEHCRDQEKYGGYSDRIQFLNNPYNKRFVPKELLANPDATNVQPTTLSVHFNNKCNMKCLYCGPDYSSSWENENEKFEHTFKLRNETEKKYTERVKKFYEWMEVNYKNLRAFDILGGEPFIQQETWECIDWMMAHPNKEIDFEIYSNFQIKPFLFKRNLEKLNNLCSHVHEVSIVASIDCWGPQLEYIRSGLELKIVEENMNCLVNEFPNIVLTLNATITSLSLPYTAELIKKVIEWKKIKPNINFTYNKCVDPVHFDPNIMPPGTYSSYIEELTELNKLLLNNNMQQSINAMFKEINESPAKYDVINYLRDSFLTKFDYRRNTNWKESFPWLKDI